MGGLDGLRALAVVAVVLYHGQDITSLPSFLKPQGGFLGVEVFFVISGFLITALLVREHEQTDGIDLKSFWIRRARRLLPALYVFLAGTTVLAALFATDALDKIRREILGAVFYVTNWLLIATDESYFDAAGRPSLLRHLWSLAIEEQFYLLWPLIVLGVLRVGGRRVLLAITLVGIVASTALLWLLFDQVEQYGDVTSVYYRTDARAAALLVGAAFALVWKPGVPRSRSAQWAIDMGGLSALGLLIAMQYFFTDRIIEWDTYRLLYHGGFLALSAATMAVIAAVASPDSRLGWALSTPALRWLGTRSYGIYLWHWPVFQLTRPRLDVDIDGYLLLGVRLAITAALVELSYRLIEVPIRERRFLKPIAAAARTPRGIMLGTAGAIGLIVATAAVALAVPTIDRTPVTEVAIVTDDRPVAEPNVVEPNVADVAPAPTPGAALTPTPAPAAQPTASVVPTPDTSVAPFVASFDPDDYLPTPEPTPSQVPLPPPPPLDQPFDITASQIHIVGDSVIEGSQGQLYRIAPGVTVDGRIGRQWWELEGELRQMRARGLGNDVVVIQLGNNGNFNNQMFEGVMNALAGTRLVIFVNIHTPVVWEAEVNSLLASAVSRYPGQARLLDWYTAAEGHPEYFVEDGTHLQGEGQVAFRRLIENALYALS